MPSRTSASIALGALVGRIVSISGAALAEPAAPLPAAAAVRFAAARAAFFFAFGLAPPLLRKPFFSPLPKLFFILFSSLAWSAAFARRASVAAAIISSIIVGPSSSSSSSSAPVPAPGSSPTPRSATAFPFSSTSWIMGPLAAFGALLPARWSIDRRLAMGSPSAFSLDGSTLRMKSMAPALPATPRGSVAPFPTHRNRKIGNRENREGARVRDAARRI